MNDVQSWPFSRIGVLNILYILRCSCTRSCHTALHFDKKIENSKDKIKQTNTFSINFTHFSTKLTRFRCYNNGLSVHSFSSIRVWLENWRFMSRINKSTVSLLSIYPRDNPVYWYIYSLATSGLSLVYLLIDPPNNCQ